MSRLNERDVVYKAAGFVVILVVEGDETCCFNQKEFLNNPDSIFASKFSEEKERIFFCCWGSFKIKTKVTKTMLIVF